MANIKSAKKRIKVASNRTERNKSVKSRVKTEIKKYESTLEAGDKTAAEAQMKVVISEISKAETKGVFHKQTASRKVSNMNKALNRM